MSPEQARLVLECLLAFYASMFSREVMVAEYKKVGIPADVDVRLIPDIKLQELTRNLRTLSRSPQGRT